MTEKESLCECVRQHDCNDHLKEVEGWGWDCTVCWPAMLEWDDDDA